MMLDREFYLRPAVQVAPELLGKLLVHETEEGVTAGMIVETEAYAGPDDDGAHSFGGRRTERTRIQYGEGGFSYVFGIYGMHWCFNAVTNGENRPEVVLIRALEPVQGIELMKKRRGMDRPEALCSGPGKLCAALGITKAQYGLDLCRGPLYISWYRDIPAEEILLSPRVNIDYAEKCRDKLWRYYIKGNGCVSKVPKRYEAKTTLTEKVFGGEEI